MLHTPQLESPEVFEGQSFGGEEQLEKPLRDQER
jgi:hypothetical protein